MKLKVIEKPFNATIEIRGKLFVKEVRKGLYCYKFISENSAYGEHEQQGFSVIMPTVKNGSLNCNSEYKLGYKSKDFDNKIKEDYGQPVLVKKGLLDKYRFHLASGGENGFYAICKEENICQTPYDHIEDKDYEIIIPYSGSFMIFNLDREPIFWQSYFDYIQAGFDNSHYDLAKCLPIIRKNKNVKFIGDDGINPVEWYNNESGNRKYICFIYSPESKDLKKIWNKCLKMGRTHPSCNKDEAIYELDMLGVKKFHYGKKFYDSKEDEKKDEQSEGDEQ